MKAVVYRDYGSPSVLQPAELPIPPFGSEQVRIQVMAAGINPIDARLRRGELKYLLPGGFPRIPGYDVAGIVEAAGPNAELSRGDRVMAFLDHVYGGGYAEYATCTHTCAIRIPNSMSFEEAAALPLAGSTALQSLHNNAHLKAGDRVLINGATGGVGTFAVQIAKANGAIVDAVASQANEEFARSLGATGFIDYKRQHFTEVDRQWDVICDVAGKSSFAEAKRSLTPDGTYVTTEPSLKGFLISLATYPMKQHGKAMLVRSRKEDLQTLVRLYQDGALKVHIASQLPLDAAAQAHRILENESFCGKLILTVGE